MSKEYLILWGGTDINPAIYGHYRHKRTQPSDHARDEKEVEAFNDAVFNNTPIIGVCRGAQLVCALNGGTLWQHTADHGESHSIVTADGTFHTVAAGHHQVMNPSGLYHVLGYDGRDKPTKVYDVDDRPYIINSPPEVIYFPLTNSIAIQPHPEWMPTNHPFNVWIRNKIKELLGVDVNFKE